MTSAHAVKLKNEIAEEVLRDADYAHMKPGLSAALIEYDVEAHMIALVAPSRFEVDQIAEVVSAVMGFFFHNDADPQWCREVARQLKDRWPDDGRGPQDDPEDWRDTLRMAIEQMELVEYKKMFDEIMKDIPVGSGAHPAWAGGYSYHFVARVLAAKAMEDFEHGHQ